MEKMLICCYAVKPKKLQTQQFDIKKWTTQKHENFPMTTTTLFKNVALLLCM